MPSRRTFRDWALREPEFGAAYEAAKDQALARQVALDRKADAGRIWRRMLSRAGRRGGSVSIYTPELGEAICARIATAGDLSAPAGGRRCRVRPAR